MSNDDRERRIVVISNELNGEKIIMLKQVEMLRKRLDTRD